MPKSERVWASFSPKQFAGRTQPQHLLSLDPPEAFVRTGCPRRLDATPAERWFNSVLKSLYGNSKAVCLVAKTSENGNNLEDSVWNALRPQLLQEQQELQLPPDEGRNLKQRVNESSSVSHCWWWPSHPNFTAQFCLFYDRIFFLICMSETKRMTSSGMLLQSNMYNRERAVIYPWPYFLISPFL